MKSNIITMAAMKLAAKALLIAVLLWMPISQARAGLVYTLNSKGLATLSYNGGPNLISDGTLRMINSTPTFTPSNGLNNTGWTATTSTLSGSTVSQTWPWGTMSCVYSQSGNNLILNISVTNTTTSTMSTADICPGMILYPQQPTASMADAGPWAMGNNVLVADPNWRPAVVVMDYGTGVIDFCNENVNDGVIASAGGDWNGSNFTLYPFLANITNLAPNTTKNIKVSMRFGATGTGNTIAADLYQRYFATYPAQLQWDDRRLLAQDVLASSPPDDLPQHQHPATNPRGWSWWCNVDFTQPTSVSYPLFRQELLQYAQESITELQNRNAQGVIFWDIEGEQYSQPTHTYVGDPTQIATLAPEMEYQDSAGKTDDLFFQAFRNAGLKVGVCIRPQKIVYNSNGWPVQTEASQAGTDIATLLQSKIAFAQSRWGCSLFYVDTTVDPTGAVYDPTPFQQTAAAYPNVLLIPEQSTARFYGFSVPFGDFPGHGVTNTNPLLYNVYPGAWTNVFAAFGNVENDIPEFQAGISCGDTMMFHGWSDGTQNNPEIQSIWNGVGQGPTSVHITSPTNGASGSLPVTITATATAASGKTISKVDFYAYNTATGSQLLGTATSAPYSIVWNNPPLGQYAISVTATDSAGLTRTPAAVNYTVRNPIPVYQVNAGGPTAAPFIADAYYTAAGTGSDTVSATITTTGVTNPAPMSVYQSERYGGNMFYTFPGLTPGASYHVRLHFAETYWSAAGKRIFNVLINNTQVMTNFDIYALVGKDAAIVQEFNTTANSSGQIVIQFNKVADNAKVSGIEILQN